MKKINVEPEIGKYPISALEPWEKNPREITEQAYKGLRDSLERFGYLGLIVVNKRNMQVVSGHQRLKVLKENGVEQVTCLVVDVDDIAQQAMAVSLNNQEIMGYFTKELVPILEHLRRQIPDDYLSLRLAELREKVGELEPDAMNGHTAPDDIPKAPKNTITKSGDLWILGDHRLLCGSSTNAEHVARLMAGKKAQLMATDPPYLVDYTGADRPNGGKDWSDMYHEIDIKDARAFLTDFLTIGMANIEEDSAIYMWHADRRLVLIYQIFQELNILMHQHIIWVKPCTVLTFSVYPWRHEPCIFGWRKGHKPFFRPAHKRIGSVWEITIIRNGDPETPEYYSDLWFVDWEGKKRNNGLEHPTVKPTEIFAIPMRVHTKPGDICYEPFSGSGSQIIAGERVNRRVFAMELEPGFCDVAVRRWEQFTGRKARLEACAT